MPVLENIIFTKFPKPLTFPLFINETLYSCPVLLITSRWKFFYISSNTSPQNAFCHKGASRAPKKCNGYSFSTQLSFPFLPLLWILIRIGFGLLDPDPALGMGIWIRQKRPPKKVKKFHALKYWMFSFKGWRLLL
jgi:hypothetical protein